MSPSPKPSPAIHPLRSLRRVMRLEYIRAELARRPTCAEILQLTWAQVVMSCLDDKPKELLQVYECVERGYPEHVRRSSNWQAKVRQTLRWLYQHDSFFDGPIQGACVFEQASGWSVHIRGPVPR